MKDFGTDHLSLDAWVSHRIRAEEGKLTEEMLRTYQQKRLQEVLDYASQNSPFHRRIGEQSLGDWLELPFTTQEDVRLQGLQMLCTSQGEIDRVVTLETSGTTGPPKRLYFTGEDQKNTIEFFRAGMATFTAPGERVMILLPGERPGSIGSLLYTAIEALGAVPIAHGMVRSLCETYEELIATAADILVGVPSQVLALARYSESVDLARKSTIRRILLSTDYVSETVVRELRRVWGCEVFRYYGMTEAGLGWGIECACHKGYHLYEADFFTEIVSPEGQPVPEGQEGEVVFTTLTRRGMPMIRYRTGDLSRILTEPCPCGSKLRRLDTIRARTEGIKKLKNGGILTLGELDEVLLDLPGILDFKAVFTEAQGCDILRIQSEFLYVSPEKSAVIERLTRVAGVHEALKDHVLMLEIDTVACDSRYIPTIGKRKIV